MAKIVFDTEYIFNAAATAEISITWLTINTFVVAYRDQGNSNYGTAIVGTVSGNSISFGNEYVFNAGSTLTTSIAALTSSKIVISYYDYLDGNSKAIIGDVSGTTISFGSEYTFTAVTLDNSVIRLTDSKFVVAYRKSISDDYNGCAKVGDVSGTTISFGSEYTFNAASTQYISATRLTDSKFAIAYWDAGNNDYGTAIIGDVSGTTITYGSEYVFNTNWTGVPEITALTSTKFVVAYVNYIDVEDLYQGKAIIGDVSGTTITYGEERKFADLGTEEEIDILELSSSKLTDSKFVLTYRNDNSGYGLAVIGEVVQTNNLAFSSGHLFNSNTYISAVAGIDDKKFVIAYRDGDNSFYGTTIIGTELIVYPSHGLMSNVAIF